MCYSNLFERTLAALKELCTSYWHAYDDEVQRNHQIRQWYRQLLVQHRDSLDQVAALASRCSSLKRDLGDMETHFLAQEAITQEYKRRLAIQSQLHVSLCRANKSADQLVQRISELERENIEIKDALFNASEFLLKAES
jgi:hypothetical protein